MKALRISWQCIVMMLAAVAAHASLTGFAGIDTPINSGITILCAAGGTIYGGKAVFEMAHHLAGAHLTWGEAAHYTFKGLAGAGTALKGPALLTAVGLSGSVLIHLVK